MGSPWSDMLFYSPSYLLCYTSYNTERWKYQLPITDLCTYPNLKPWANLDYNALSKFLGAGEIKSDVSGKCERIDFDFLIDVKEYRSFKSFSQDYERIHSLFQQIYLFECILGAWSFHCHNARTRWQCSF